MGITEDIAFEVDGADRSGRWIVTCDHASNAVPDFVNGGKLGLPAEDMGRHIAYDVGADGLSRKLAELLNGPVILSKFSRRLRLAILARSIRPLALCLGLLNLSICSM